MLFITQVHYNYLNYRVNSPFPTKFLSFVRSIDIERKHNVFGSIIMVGSSLCHTWYSSDGLEVDYPCQPFLLVQSPSPLAPLVPRK